MLNTSNSGQSGHDGSDFYGGARAFSPYANYPVFYIKQIAHVHVTSTTFEIWIYLDYYSGESMVTVTGFGAFTFGDNATTTSAPTGNWINPAVTTP